MTEIQTTPEANADGRSEPTLSRGESAILDSADWALALTLTVLMGSIYVATLCPTVFWYDSAEMAAAAATLGIPHPPGYPLYTIVAWCFTWLPVEPAYAVNLMSAFFGASAVGSFYLLTRAQPLTRPACAFGALMLGLSPLIWSNSTVAEVYMPGLATLNVVMYLLLSGVRLGAPRRAVLAAFIAGLGLGFHMSIAVCGLGLAWLAWLPTRTPQAFDEPLQSMLRRDKRTMRIRRLLPLTGATLLGACIFLWLPIRTAMEPVFMFKAIDSARELFYMVTSKAYQSFFKDDISVWSSATYLGAQLQENLTWPGIGLLVFGGATAARRVPQLLVVWMLCITANFSIFYNYKVHDLEVFFIPSFMVCIWIACNGADAVLCAVRATMPSQRIATYSLSAALLTLPILQLVEQFPHQDRAEMTEARAWGERFLEELPENALLISFESRPEWHLASVIRYLRFAEGRRPDVEEWNRATPDMIIEQLRRKRPVFTYIGHGLPGQRFRLRPRGLLFQVVGIEVGGLESKG